MTHKVEAFRTPLNHDRDFVAWPHFTPGRWLNVNPSFMRRSDDDAWAVFTRYPVPPEPGTGSIWAVRVDARMQPVGMLVSLIGHGIDPRAIRVGERVPIFYAIRGSSMALTASYTPVLMTSHPLLMAPYHTGMHRYRLLCGRDDGETAGFAIDQSELAAHLVRPRHGPTGTVHDDRGGNGAPEAGTPPRISAVHLSKARPPIPLRSRTGFDGRRLSLIGRRLWPGTCRRQRPGRSMTQRLQPIYHRLLHISGTDTNRRRLKTSSIF